VKINVAYKFRIYPNTEQEIILNQTFGCCRFLWNQMLHERTQVYKRFKADKESLRSYPYKTEKQYKQKFSFLKEPDAKALQNVTRNLFAAFQNFIASLTDQKRQVGYPRFKAKHGKQSYTTNNINDNIKIDFARKKLKLPKIAAWVAYRDDRVFAEPIKSVTVSKTKSGKFFAALLIARELPVTPKATLHEEHMAAFDMSFASFLVSETEKLENPRFYRKQESKLKTLHRQLSRKTKGSRNRAQARLRLARFYDKIGNARTDWLHKQSTTLAGRYETIILENVNLEGIKRFNKGFAKTVTLDFSWGVFTWMLRYKMEWLGKHLIRVDRFFPSTKRCSQCGHIHAELQLAERTWTCPECGTQHERDENAAKNLRKEGMRLLREERNVHFTQAVTAGTAGSHASGDRVRPIGAGR
jgi:putative transposase